MPRRIFPVLFIISAVLLLTACGSQSSGVRFALVTGPGGTDTDAEIQAVVSGMEGYAAEHAYETKTYTAEIAGAESYAEQFKAAAEAGAKYVIAVGREMEIPVYSAQGAHRKTRFVLVDGEPRKNETAASSIRKNTECVTFDRYSMGFLAGCIAVKEGYRKIAWLSGRETREGAEYYEGFLNGVGYGMKEQQLGRESVTVLTEFAGTDELTPRRAADAKNLYNEGAQLIVTDREKIAKALAKEAPVLQKPYATVGFNALSGSQLIQFSVVANPEGAVRSLLASFDEAKGFAGGTSIVCTAAESGIRLAAEYSRMPVVTEVDTQTVLAAMATGQAIVSNGAGTEENPALGQNVYVEQRESVVGAVQTVPETDYEELDSFVETTA